MALRKLQLGGTPIDWDKDYPSLSAANQLICSLAEFYGIPVTLGEYQGKKFPDRSVIMALHAALEKEA